jgi:hypothetical protein
MMRRTYRNLFWLSLSLTVACGGGDNSDGSGARGALAASEGDGSEAPGSGDGDGTSDEDPAAGDGDGDGGGDGDGDGDDTVSVDDLDCPQGSSTTQIDVAFNCDEITVVSCKDLSNVVLELADGTHQKTEGLHGQTGTFGGTGDQAGEEIVGVWVKSGSNASGDGPGYGERFDAPEGGCDPVGEPQDPEDPPADEDPPVANDPPEEDPDLPVAL